MRKKPSPKKSSESSLRILLLFCVIVITAIGLSLGYRLFTLMRDSMYDSKHNFIIAFTYRNDVDFVEVNSEQKTLSHLQVRGGNNLINTKKEVGVLSDTDISLSKPFSLDSLSNYFTDATWHKNNIKSNLNIFDLYRLHFATKHISPQSITSERIHIPIDTSLSSTMLEQLFLDETIDQENKTVSIINGTGVVGLGTRLERALSNMGINVISVKNADRVESASVINYNGEESYTLDRLQNLLLIPTNQTSSVALSDIIILIGKDMSQTTRF